VEDGTIAEDRINDAVRRILTVKQKIGLFENAYPDRALINEIGSTEHREVARQAVRESLVLLKNEGDALGSCGARKTSS
jgi:beta-glucosidase